MMEPKVQPLVTLIRCCSQVVKSFRLGHGIPLLVSTLVPEHIIGLDQEVDDNVHA
jgi:hypothetical protein